jgi:hypothetical protein
MMTKNYTDFSSPTPQKRAKVSMFSSKNKPNEKQEHDGEATSGFFVMEKAIFLMVQICSGARFDPF